MESLISYNSSCGHLWYFNINMNIFLQTGRINDIRFDLFKTSLIELNLTLLINYKAIRTEFLIRFELLFISKKIQNNLGGNFKQRTSFLSISLCWILGIWDIKRWTLFNVEFKVSATLVGPQGVGVVVRGATRLLKHPSGLFRQRWSCRFHS